MLFSLQPVPVYSSSLCLFAACPQRSSKGFNWFSRLLIVLPAIATAPWPVKTFKISISDCLNIGLKPCSLRGRNGPKADPLHSYHPLAAEVSCPSWARGRFLSCFLSLQCPLVFNLFWFPLRILREVMNFKRYHDLPRCNFRLEKHNEKNNHREKESKYRDLGPSNIQDMSLKGLSLSLKSRPLSLYPFQWRLITQFEAYPSRHSVGRWERHGIGVSLPC